MTSVAKSVLNDVVKSVVKLFVLSPRKLNRHKSDLRWRLRERESISKRVPYHEGLSTQPHPFKRFSA